MPDTHTPGHICYAAYCLVTYGAAAHPADYSTLTWGQRDAWEAAAQAVLEQGKLSQSDRGYSQWKGPT